MKDIADIIDCDEGKLKPEHTSSIRDTIDHPDGTTSIVLRFAGDHVAVIGVPNDMARSRYFKQILKRAFDGFATHGARHARRKRSQ